MKRQIWTDEQCATHFGHGRRMNHATRDEVLEALRESVRKHQELKKMI